MRITRTPAPSVQFLAETYGYDAMPSEVALVDALRDLGMLSAKRTGEGEVGLDGPDRERLTEILRAAR